MLLFFQLHKKKRKKKMTTLHKRFSTKIHFHHESTALRHEHVNSNKLDRLLSTSLRSQRLSSIKYVAYLDPGVLTHLG